VTIPGSHRRRVLLTAIIGSSVAVASAGCGSSSRPALPTVAPAKTYRLAGLRPTRSVEAGRPVEVALRILQPSGAPLTRYRTGAGPHTGVDLIIVPRDLRTLFYEDPPVAKDGSVRQSMTFSTAGSYRVVVDAFPDTPGIPSNVQLFAMIHVTGSTPTPTPRFGLTTTVGGYRFAIQGRPRLRAIAPAFLTVKVTDARGRPVVFTPLDGALAHAIFFREGTLDYFHTHVCAPGAIACASATRGPVGSATKPGVLRIGVLPPASGTWRLFLRTKIAGRELLTPFTLTVG
jgi:hypothetical protein